MTGPFKPDFVDLCGVLNRHGVRYLVMGGWAAIVHGLPRTTQDVDVFIPPDPENTRRLIEALSTIGFGTARELTPEMILNRFIFMFADQIRVDLFVKPWGLPCFEDVERRKRVVELKGIPVPVVSIDDLIASKRTDRAQDIEDVKALEAIRARGTPSPGPRPAP
jgi:predicted nucleotidyltransferase